MHIGYVNVQGLDFFTLQQINSWIHTLTYDLLIVSETWFQSRSQYLSSSLFITESTYPKNPQKNRRQDGGLVLLAHPSIHSSLSCFFRSRYAIGLNVNGFKLGFVYFPPSLSTDQVAFELSNLGPINQLLGDMNVRLGKQTGDRITTDATRYQTILNYTDSYHMSFQKNTNMDSVSRTDHLFSTIKQPWTYHWTLPFSTDHGLMSFVLQNTLATPRSTSAENNRFDFKPLLNESFSSLFVLTYDELYGQTLLENSNKLLQTCCESMILPSTLESQILIDSAYEFFMSSVLELLQDMLQTYNTHVVKATRDRMQATCDQAPLSVNETIMKFKKSQRYLKSTNPIQSSNSDKTPLQDCTDYYNTLFASNEINPPMERTNDIIFGLHFQWKLIHQAISEYPNYKSMGPDGIHVLVLKTLSHSNLFQKMFQNLFQVYASTGLTPTYWSTCNLHLLIKDENNPIAPNTRPIALSPIIRRIFEKCLMQLWNHSNETWLKLDYGQAGFRRGYSTLSHLILSDEISRRDNKISIFLDLKAAFDSVSWNILKETLTDRGCPPISKSLIMSLICRPANLLLTVNHSNISAIKTSKGVFQGGGISALIFAIYIDPLAKQLNQNCAPHRPLALLYADDIQLKPKSTEQGQHLLDVCTIFAQDYGLSWNTKKCGVVGTTSQDFLLDNTPLPKVDSYKYLGAIHKSNRVDWFQTYNSAVEKQRRFLSAISANKWHPLMKLIIFRTFARPITEYVLVPTWLWACKDPKNRQETLLTIKNSHKNGIKFIFGYDKHYQLMDFITGFGPSTHRLQSLYGSLVRSFRRLDINNPLVAARSIYQLSSSKHHILSFCFTSKYVTQYDKIQQQSNKMKLRWKTHLKIQLQTIQKKLALKFPTLAYFQPSQTLKNNGSQALLLPAKILKRILAWRLNLALHQRPCLCSDTFTRAHLSCILHDNPLYREIEDSTSFQTQRLTLKFESSAHHYTVLDHLLNQLRFNDFIALFEVLTELLNR